VGIFARTSTSVIPAKAGSQKVFPEFHLFNRHTGAWIPVYAGMTHRVFFIWVNCSKTAWKMMHFVLAMDVGKQRISTPGERIH
jgi:hypothetical protein